MVTWNRELQQGPPTPPGLPEDDADAQIAREFQLELSYSAIRTMQVLPAASGWLKVVESFESNQ